MESDSSDGTPPLCGFNDDGDPVSVTVGDTEAEVEEDEFATPAAAEVFGDYILRSRAVNPSTRPQRRFTLPHDNRTEPFPSRTRLLAALK